MNKFAQIYLDGLAKEAGSEEIAPGQMDPTMAGELALTSTPIASAVYANRVAGPGTATRVGGRSVLEGVAGTLAGGMLGERIGGFIPGGVVSKVIGGLLGAGIGGGLGAYHGAHAAAKNFNKRQIEK